MNKFYDDKDLVIISTTVIAILAMLYMPESLNLVTNIVTGLFGVAVGQGMTKTS
jgi:hypothetical protein